MIRLNLLPMAIDSFWKRLVSRSDDKRVSELARELDVSISALILAMAEIGLRVGGPRSRISKKNVRRILGEANLAKPKSLSVEASEPRLDGSSRNQPPRQRHSPHETQRKVVNAPASNRSSVSRTPADGLDMKLDVPEDLNRSAQTLTKADDAMPAHGVVIDAAQTVVVLQQHFPQGEIELLDAHVGQHDYGSLYTSLEKILVDTGLVGLRLSFIPRAGTPIHVWAAQPSRVELVQRFVDSMLVAELGVSRPDPVELYSAELEIGDKQKPLGFTVTGSTGQRSSPEQQLLGLGARTWHQRQSMMYSSSLQPSKPGGFRRGQQTVKRTGNSGHMSSLYRKLCSDLNLSFTAEARSQSEGTAKGYVWLLALQDSGDPSLNVNHLIRHGIDSKLGFRAFWFKPISPVARKPKLLDIVVQIEGFFSEGNKANFVSHDIIENKRKGTLKSEWDNAENLRRVKTVVENYFDALGREVDKFELIREPLAKTVYKTPLALLCFARACRADEPEVTLWPPIIWECLRTSGKPVARPTSLTDSKMQRYYFWLNKPFAAIADLLVLADLMRNWTSGRSILSDISMDLDVKNNALVIQFTMTMPSNPDTGRDSNERAKDVARWFNDKDRLGKHNLQDCLFRLDSAGFELSAKAAGKRVKVRLQAESLNEIH